MKSKLFLTLMLLLSVVGWARADELTIYEGATGTNSYVPVYGMWADSYQKCEFIIPAEELNDMDNAIISEMTFYLNQKASAAWTGTFQVFLKEVGDATISNYTGTNGATIVYEGTLDATGETMTVAFSSEYLYAGGNLLVGVYEIVPGSYAGASFFGANVAGASVGGYNSAGLDAVSANARNFIPKTTFTYTAGEAPSCVKPKSLTVNYTGGTTAVVSWTSDAEAWILSVNGTETAVTENSYTLTELALGTTYEIKVRTDCGGGDLSDWTNPVSFTTDFCLEEEQCLVNITLTDAYSDGGGSIKVVDAETEKVLGSFTCSGASSEYTLSVCPGREINFVFASTDSYSYDFDIYPLVRRFSDIASFTPNLRQKTLENFMGLWSTRSDKIDGGDSVRMYYDYLVSRSDALKEKILLHNHDDVVQLYRLLAVTGRADMHAAMRRLGFPVSTHRGTFIITKSNIKGDGLTIRGKQPSEGIKYRYPGDGYFAFEFDRQGSFTIELATEQHDELLLADLTRLPVSEAAFSSLPTYGSGYLVLRRGAQGKNKGTENHMEINLLAQQMLAGIISEI